jgi:hypothetical protein
MAIDKQVQPQPLPTEIPTDGPIEIELELPIEEGEEFADVLEMPQGGNFDENLADALDDDVLGMLSSELIGLYEEDKESRQDWYEAFTKGLDLLGIKSEERTQPFQGASGVDHPILSEAVTQFQAQAYKELLPPGGPVQVQVVGDQCCFIYHFLVVHLKKFISIQC